jgi:hypothetical protein
MEKMEVVHRSLSTLLPVQMKLKSWEDCIPRTKFADKNAKHRIIERSTFMILYDFKPPMALNLAPPTTT